MAEGAPRIALSDGNSMPQLGFGTWQIGEADCPRLVGEAIAAGYRSIDTAEGHGNEAGIGQAIRASAVPRENLFITSKLRNAAHTRDLALQSFDETMTRLGLAQLDLFLIHWPVPAGDKYVEAWRTLIELRAEGRVRSIGVSNFDPVHIDRLVRETGVTPVVNQIELHPRYQQRDRRGYHQRRGIALASWSPLGPGTGNTAWWWTHGRATAPPLLADDTIAAIAAKHGKSAAQVIIRWHLDEGLILNPKSVEPARIKENFDVFDFRLDAEDRYRIEALDSPTGKIGAEPAEWNLMF